MFGLGDDLGTEPLQSRPFSQRVLCHCGWFASKSPGNEVQQQLRGKTEYAGGLLGNGCFYFGSFQIKWAFEPRWDSDYLPPYLPRYLCLSFFHVLLAMTN